MKQTLLIFSCAFICGSIGALTLIQRGYKKPDNIKVDYLCSVVDGEQLHQSVEKFLHDFRYAGVCMIRASQGQQ